MADDARRQLQRAWDQSATDMRQSMQAGAGRVWDGLGQDARASLGRAWDQSADDLRQAMQRGATQAASAGAADMRQGFGQAFDQSANDMRDAFRRAANQAAGDMQGAMGDAGQAGGAAGGEAAGGSFADKIGGKGGPIFQAVIGVMSLAGAAAGGVLISAMGDAMQREASLDLTQARLGVDDATMKAIGDAAGRAYTDAFGASVEENTDTARRAIQTGLIDPTATGAEIQQVISQLSGISDLMGEEIPAVARAAGQAIKTGIAGDAAGAFDLFAAAERNGLNVSEDFLDTVTEYGTQFRKLGLDGPDAIGLINQAVKAGARDVDVAADAIKEFSIRAVDGSESTATAFADLNLNAEDMARRFAAGGQSARDATAEILRSLRDIDDPLKRGQIAVGLFGTQWEDLGGAFDALDLDTAAAGLGKVAGAAQDAIDTMGSNAATSVESAKRSMEVTLQDLGGALAQAFGPSLAKFADWVSTHKPEILGFLGDLVDAGFVAADAMLGFSSMSLRAFAGFAEGAAGALASVVDPLGRVAEIFGKITGDDEVTKLGQALQGLDGTLLGAADRARQMADVLDNQSRPGLDRLRESIGMSIDEAVLAQEMFRALGDEVTAVPTEKGIRVSDNSPEIIANLQALGLKVEQVPGSKEINVTASTAQGQAALDAFIVANNGRQISVEVMASLSAQSRALAAQTQNSGSQTYSQGYVRYAAGGITRPGDAKIADTVVNQYAEEAPEAYIPLSPARRDRSVPIWLEAGRRLGMVDQWATGGIAGERATQWASSYDGRPYIYGSQDCSWYMSGIYNQLTGQSVRFTTASDLSQYGFVPGNDPTGFTIGNNGGVGTGGHMAGRLLGTPVESDGSNGVQYGGTADGPEGFPEQWYLPRDLWSPPATDDPSLGTGGAALGSPGGGASGASPSGGGSVPGGGPGASSTGGVTIAGQEIPAGVVPVWMVNASGGVSTIEPTPPDTSGATSSTASGGAQPAEMPDVGARLGEMGGDFLSANVDQLLGDLGFRRSGGAVQALVSAIYDAMADAAAAEVKRQQNKQGSAVAQFIGGR